MSGDPARRPSDERVRLPGVDTMIWIECSSCLGDGWHYPERGLKNRKITCGICEGQGRRQIPAISRRPSDRVVI